MSRVQAPIDASSAAVIVTECARIADAARLLVALDFDGTLAPLQDEPMKSRMLPAAREALDSLVQLPNTTVALVSGRTLHDLRIIAEHDDDSQIYLAGSHGAEFWHPRDAEPVPVATAEDSAAIELRDELRGLAEQLVDPYDGVWIEPKAFGFGLHTRLASRSDALVASKNVDDLVARLAPAWRRRTGHDIREFAYRHEGKDSAIALLRGAVSATTVLFAGDDVTDEDAMRSLESGDLGVRVGDGHTHANLRVADAASLARLLAELASTRRAR